MGTFFRAKIDCCAPPAAADFRLRGYKIIIRKQVTPLDLQKFFPKYSDNQKWATPLDLQKFLPKYSENQKWATPLDLQKFFPKYSDNQKWATPLIRPKLCFVHLPPRGKAISKAIIKISNGL